MGLEVPVLRRLHMSIFTTAWPKRRRLLNAASSGRLPAPQLAASAVLTAGRIPESWSATAGCADWSQGRVSPPGIWAQNWQVAARGVGAGCRLASSRASILSVS